MHQCAHFSHDPRASHRDMIIHLVKYLKATRTQGIMLDYKVIKRFEVYVDANFCGNWHFTKSGNNPSTSKSRTGYVILYVGCLIVWCSNLHTHIALSMTEAEYIALSQLLLDTIPTIKLLR